MQDSIATASKNVARIKARKYAHYGFRAFQKALGDRDHNGINTLLLAPRFDDSDSLGNVLNRVAWYFPNSGSQAPVELLVPTDPETLDSARSKTPQSQAEYSLDVPVTAVPPGEFSESATQADRILLWDKDARFSPSILRHLTKIEFVDPLYYSATEPNTWERMSSLAETNTGLDSRQNFESLENKAAEYEEAFVFATGPSLSDVLKYDIPDAALKIVCNSIVKNDELLEHIDPDVLTFADPVFHFGPSRYADTFREDAIDVLQSYDCVGVVPEVYAPLLQARYPDVDLIGMDNRQLGHPNIPSATDQTVWATGNIMTLFMLPIATGLTDDVYIAGADGRKEDESYFWEHSDEAQYDDELMQTVADCHPAFFRDRIYEDYYDRHVEILTEMIEFGESRGVNYHTITNSYVPCLAERTLEELSF